MARVPAELAGRFLELLEEGLRRPYPNKIAHVLNGDQDARPPRQLTPIFYGCFDWHSAVHSHWSLVRLLPRLDENSALRVGRLLDESFRPEGVAGELTYLEGRPGFEMPYGMAWLLQLAAELGERPWRAVLRPLEQAAADRLVGGLECLSHPIRTGQHDQTAFAMGLGLDHARAAGNRHLAERLGALARRFYAGDRLGPLAYEPSGHDFLSPCLAEADLMRRVLEPEEFAGWLDGFLPDLSGLAPVTPVSRSDGKLVHFDGLNLSRAWMLRGIASALPNRPDLGDLAEAHGRAGMTWLEGATYAGTHWLVSFSLYWLT
ncbi:MAG: DUF2891 domain-containing protein [Candidatus Eremiobacterota bacterium]